MSEIEIGDKGTWRGREVVVKGIDGDAIWAKLGDGDYVNTRNFVPASKTFEIGKTYQHKNCPVVMFSCQGLWGSFFSGRVTVGGNVAGNIDLRLEKFGDWEEI